VTADPDDKARRRAGVAKHRAAGKGHDRQQLDAWRTAQRRLRELHPDDWVRLYSEERQRRGLKPARVVAGP
jgi:hypothetical protein